MEGSWVLSEHGSCTCFRKDKEILKQTGIVSLKEEEEEFKSTTWVQGRCACGKGEFYKGLHSGSRSVEPGAVSANKCSAPP